MENERIDEIVYEGEWQCFSEPIKVDNTETSDVTQVADKQKSKRSFTSLITFQLIICLLVAFVIFILKSMNGSTFKSLHLWYKEQNRKTLFSNEVFENIDLIGYFGSTTDSVPSTYDEIPFT